MDLWTEAHSPKTLNDIIGQNDIVVFFKNCVKLRFIPDITLAGKPGTGKTAIVKAFANDLGILTKPGMFIVLNASDERGIGMVREQIKSQAQKPTLYGLPRLIFLDEGDNITKDAQSALRAIIQEFSSNTRFIIACNYPSELLEPIISRCPMKTVYPLSSTDLGCAIDRIQTKEKFQISQDARQLLIDISQGDLRKLIGKLQNAAILSNFDIKIQHIDNNDVSLNTAKKILEIAQQDFGQAREILMTEFFGNKEVKILLQRLFEASQEVRFSNTVPENEIIQRRIQDKISEIDFRLSQGTNIIIQLNSLINYVKLIKYIPIQCPKAR